MINSIIRGFLFIFFIVYFIIIYISVYACIHCDAAKDCGTLITRRYPL